MLSRGRLIISWRDGERERWETMDTCELGSLLMEIMYCDSAFPGEKKAESASAADWSLCQPGCRRAKK